MLLTFLRNFRKMEIDKILLDVSDGLDMRKINGDLYAVLKFKFLFMGATFLKKYHKNPFWKRGNNALFSFPKRKKFQKRSWQPCRLTAFSYDFKSPRSSSQKPTQAWIFCSAQGYCAARGSFGIFHQAVILRFAHGAQTGQKIFPPSYLAPNKKSKLFHRTRWDKIPHGGVSCSVGAPPLR